MNISDIAQMFNRSLKSAFNLQKFLYFFLMLIFSGIMLLFFYGWSLFLNDWLKFPLFFFPLFIAIAVLLTAGAAMIKVHLSQQQTNHESLKTIFYSTPKLFWRSIYFAIPFLLAFFLIWVVLGVFILIKNIPYLGHFFGVVLAFGPFLLNLATIFLYCAVVLMFFFCTPMLALGESFDRSKLMDRIRLNPFMNLLYFSVAFVPVWIFWVFVKKAAWMTFEIYSFGAHAIETVLQSFFIMLPFLAVLTPVMIFFFNFASEAHQIQEYDK